MILDTNAISALLRGDAALAAVLPENDSLHLPVIAIGEYRAGVARSRDRSRLGRLLDLLIAQSILLPVDNETTFHYASLREDLRRRGRPIPENDLWIGAIARQYDLPVVTRDEHFDSIPDVARVAW